MLGVHCNNGRCKYNKDGSCDCIWDITIEVDTFKPVCTTCDEGMMQVEDLSDEEYKRLIDKIRNY